MSTAWIDNVMRQTARKPACIARDDHGCSGPVERLSDQGHGICRRHRQQLARAGRLDIGGIVLEVTNG